MGEIVRGKGYTIELKPLTNTRKLELLIEFVESGEMGLAHVAVKEWALPIIGHKKGYPLYGNPVFAPFANKLPTSYWGEFEPLLSDLKAALEKLWKSED